MDQRKQDRIRRFRAGLADDVYAKGTQKAALRALSEPTRREVELWMQAAAAYTVGTARARGQSDVGAMNATSDWDRFVDASFMGPFIAAVEKFGPGSQYRKEARAKQAGKELTKFSALAVPPPGVRKADTLLYAGEAVRHNLAAARSALRAAGVEHKALAKEHPLGEAGVNAALSDFSLRIALVNAALREAGARLSKSKDGDPVYRATGAQRRIAERVVKAESRCAALMPRLKAWERARDVAVRSVSRLDTIAKDFLRMDDEALAQKALEPPQLLSSLDAAMRLQFQEAAPLRKLLDAAVRGSMERMVTKVAKDSPKVGRVR